MKIIHGHSEQLALIASKMLPDIVGDAGFGPCQALGVASDDGLEAVCVYHEYQPKFKTCGISFAAFSPRWSQRGIIRALLSVPFKQYGVKKLWCSTTIDNKRCQRFVKGIGFKQEAILVHQFGKGRHAVLFRMMDGDFNRLYEKGFSIPKKCAITYKKRGGVDQNLPALSYEEEDYGKINA